MTFWAEAKDGTEFLLGMAKTIYLTREQEVPADLLKVTFRADGQWEELSKIYAYHEGKLVFGGIVDEQILSMDENGFSVELVCRSLSALLLDNEAEPVTLQSPSWRVMCQKYAKNVGLTARDEIYPSAIRGSFAIQKGENCWSVLSRYAKLFLNRTLYVNQKGEVSAEKPKNEKVWLNEIISAKEIYYPCKRISRVCVQDASGAYKLEYANRQQEKISRQRFFSYADTRSAFAYMQEAEKQAHQRQVTCAAYLDILPGDSVDWQVAGFPLETDCIVKKVRFTSDANGIKTLLWV